MFFEFRDVLYATNHVARVEKKEGGIEVLLLDKEIFLACRADETVNELRDKFIYQVLFSDLVKDKIKSESILRNAAAKINMI